MKAIYLKIMAALLFGYAAIGQSAKLNLTPADYGKWGKLLYTTIAPDGNWVSFKMEYESGKDTLFLMNAKTKRKLNFPNAVSATFESDGNQCAVKYPAGALTILDLKNQFSVSYANVAQFDWASDGNYLMLAAKHPQNNTLKFFNHRNQLQWQLENVSEYTLWEKSRVAIVNADGVSLIDLQKQSSPIPIYKDLESDTGRLNWSASGNSLAFFSRLKKVPDSLKIVLYNLQEKSTAMLNASNVKFHGVRYNIEPYKLIISEDGKKVYFNVTDVAAVFDREDLVQVWDSESILEYPQQELLKDPSTHPYLTIWDTATGLIQKPDSGDFINTKILPGGKYAIAASKSSMVSRTSEFPPADYYSIDLLTSESTLIATQLPTASGLIKTSPSGRYLAYFKNGHYFIYDNKTRNLKNVTAALPLSFKDEEFDDAGENPGYFIPGWTTDSKYVVLYDQFDVWLFSPDGKVTKRITNGRPDGTQFRLELTGKDKIFDNGMQLSRENIDLTKGILLSAKGNEYTSGYFWYSLKDRLNKFCNGKYKVANIVKAANTDQFIYTDETDSRPPRLMMMDKSGREPEMIFQSNNHYSKYNWSRSELIHYTNSKGDELKGVLMYPANYKPGKKYPMVVYIYERLSNTLYDYVYPVSRHHIGFSLPNYLHDGYFILMPDTKYEIGLPGPSAADCVTSAVKSVLKRNVVEENHIGLLGHSFGGFQTAFIITQTPLFAAAVASGAITDPVSSYLTWNPQRYRSENWRYEDHQYRMQSSPFNNWQGYLKNSTIANAANITTPLLSWNGKKDASVNFEQGLELHLALRALGKPNVFLLYPDQEHVLFDPVAQLDLTTRVKAWFDKYLKNQ